MSFWKSSFLGVAILSLSSMVISDVNAQCNYTDSSFIVIEGGDPNSITPPAYPPSLYSLKDGDLPTISDQVVAAPGFFEGDFLTPSDIITAMTFDRKGNALYLALNNMQTLTNRIVALPLPLSGSAPVEILTVIGPSSERISKLTVDYTNGDKVYFAIEDFSFQQFRIERFNRSNTLSTQTSEPVLGFQGNGLDGELLLLRHRRSNASGDGSLLIAANTSDQIPVLYNIALPAILPVTPNPDPTDTDLFSGLPAVDGRFFYDMEYDEFSNELVAIRNDLNIPNETLHLTRYLLTDTDSPASSDVTASFNATGYTAGNCARISLGLKAEASASNQRLLVRCSPNFPNTPPSTTPSAILTFNAGFTPVNPLRQDGTLIAVVPDSYKLPAPESAVIACCSGEDDFDTDGDAIKDCADAQPLVPNMGGGGGGGSPDTDGDTIPDVIDDCPNDFAPEGDLILTGVLGFGCPCLDRNDNDGDGLLNCQELPADQNIPVGSQCTDTGDADRDGTSNCNDACPTDPLKIEAKLCGCEVPETDGCKDPCTNGVQDLGCGCGVSPCTDPSKTVLTKFTKITEAAVITVTVDAATGKKNVEITLKKFDSALIPKKLSTQAAAKGAKLSVRYDVSVQKIEGGKKKSVIRRTVRSNSVLLRKLSSGLYTAKYRALIKSKDKREGSKEKTVSKTSFSPASTFSL
jgi:hypothetical protein